MRRPIRVALALSALSFDVTRLLAAQSDTSKTPPGGTAGTGATGSTQSPAPSLPVLDSVEVIGVVTAGTPTDTTPTRAGIGDRIVVHVRHLRSLASRAACLSIDEKPVTGCTPQKMALYLDGREIKDLVPESGAPELQKNDGDLHFHIQRSAASDEAWADLLGSPRLGPYFFTRPTRLSVGFQNGFALPTKVTETKFELLRIREWRFWFATAGLLILLLGILRLARRTNLLRDAGASYPVTQRVSGTLKVQATLKPYSLARCQMAFWFVL